MPQPLTAAVRYLSGEREPVRVATTEDITLQGIFVIDDVELEVGDRVLVKDQTDKRQNGIYLASEGNWYRAPDANYTRAIDNGVTVRIQEGTAGNGKDYRFTTERPVVGVDAIELEPIFAAFEEELQQAIDAANSAAQQANETLDEVTQKAQDILDTLVFAVVSTRAELKDVDTAQFNTVYLQEPGREGWFDFRNGDYSSRAAADTTEGVVIKANAIPATSGAWVRQKFFDYETRQFGGAGSAAIQAIETNGGGVYRVGGGVAAPTLPTTFTGTVVDYDGPTVPVNFYAETGPEIRKAKRAWKMQHGGPHAGETLSGFHIQSTIAGSGKNGPNNASIGQSISAVKKNAPSGAAYGEVDGLYIIIRQGGPTPTSFDNSSDHSGILIDSSSYGNCGHGFAVETALRNLDSAGNVLFQVQNQMGGIQTNWAAFNPDGSLNGTPLGTRFVFGFNSQMLTGMGDVAYLVEGAAQWDRAFSVGSVKSSALMYIGGDGSIVMGPSATRFFIRNQAGTFAIRNAADSADIFRVDQTNKLYLAANQVLTTRRTGWAVSAGTPSRATFNADTAITFATASATYNQTEIQNLRNTLVMALQNIHALRTDLTTHGLIGA